MVEPVPWLYERLRENYKTQLGVAFENAAIAGVDAPVPFYYVPPVENRLWGDGPIWSDVVGSLSRAEVEGSIAHGRDFAAQALRVEIPDHEIQSRRSTSQASLLNHFVENTLSKRLISFSSTPRGMTTRSSRKSTSSVTGRDS